MPSLAARARPGIARRMAYRVGANLAASTFRRRGAERRANRRAADLLSTAREPATAEHLAVREALKTLTPAQREAVLLRHYFGLSATETTELAVVPRRLSGR